MYEQEKAWQENSKMLASNLSVLEPQTTPDLGNFLQGKSRLSVLPKKSEELRCQQEDDDPLPPILGLCVWEHALYTLRRSKSICVRSSRGLETA